MTESILVALITGGMALLGVIVTSSRSAQQMDAKLDKQIAVMDTKLETLTREVRAHNDFATHIPTMETRIDNLEGRVKALEGYHKQPMP